MFKVNNWHQNDVISVALVSVSIANFENILQKLLVFVLLILNVYFVG